MLPMRNKGRYCTNRYVLRSAPRITKTYRVCWELFIDKNYQFSEVIGVSPKAFGGMVKVVPPRISTA